ncbi:MCE family protein [Nocardioides daeguensis]|uniref:MCE family protein n=1 Tax=Nocardioides daeguensis TaxID=908359 RepID=A0ABP6UTU3_9ACTN|nr:MCE family protein [Nocardioides daeguensis]MBV6725565.1 MCE family protein [Nocardioides daeguensis]MCR1771425.1 MCE family protein [Nocardioides daeguensis]
MSKAKDVRLGLLGTLVVAALVVAALRLDSLPLVGDNDLVRADFGEVGGLTPGDDVIISGATVGKVKEVELDGAKVRVGFTLADRTADLGDRTEAKIVTVTLLGHAALELVPGGEGEFDRDRTIPVERTSSPYDVTSALGDLATEVDEIDVDQLSASLTSISRTFENTPQDVRRALAGIDQVAANLGDNAQVLQQLLDRSARVSGVLADRNEQVTTLLTAGQSLFTQVQDREAVLVSLLTEVRQLARTVRAVMRENDADLGPALKELTALTQQLNRNRKNILGAIDGLRGYAYPFAEAVSSGPFFDAYIQNLTAPTTLLPIVSGLVQ